MAKGSVTRKDTGLWRALAAGGLDGTIRVGVAAGVSYPENGPTVAEVATWNHFGTDTIPARPFLSVALDGRNPEMQAMSKRVAAGIIRKPQAVREIMGAFGEWCRNRVIATINAGFPPPNAESTVSRKGSSLPLVDTGLLKGSITYRVE